MKSKLWIVSLSSLVLVSGCVAPSGDFCDIARPIYIGGDHVVDWLSENDEVLLRSVVSHNEMTEKCL
jgi:hypothetical protein